MVENMNVSSSLEINIIILMKKARKGERSRKDSTKQTLHSLFYLSSVFVCYEESIF